MRVRRVCPGRVGVSNGGVGKPPVADAAVRAGIAERDAQRAPAQRLAEFGDYLGAHVLQAVEDT